MSSSIYPKICANSKDERQVFLQLQNFYTSGISLNLQSNWNFYNYFYPGLGTKLSGDVNMFSVKCFISQWNLTQELNAIGYFIFFFTYYLCGVHPFCLELDRIASLLHWGRFSHRGPIHHLSTSWAAENLPGERKQHVRN